MWKLNLTIRWKHLAEKRSDSDFKSGTQAYIPTVCLNNVSSIKGTSPCTANCMKFK